MATEFNKFNKMTIISKYDENSRKTKSYDIYVLDTAYSFNEETDKELFDAVKNLSDILKKRVIAENNEMFEWLQKMMKDNPDFLEKELGIRGVNKQTFDEFKEFIEGAGK